MLDIKYCFACGDSDLSLIIKKVPFMHFMHFVNTKSFFTDLINLYILKTVKIIFRGKYVRQPGKRNAGYQERYLFI